MKPDGDTPTAYRLDAQIGFLLRRVNQRHLAIFARHIDDVTPMQFAALAKLIELGEISQNALGRATAMDAATIKGVVDRLRVRGLVADRRDPEDQRRVYLRPTAAARALFDGHAPRAHDVTTETLAPLSAPEQQQLLALLRKLV